MLVQEKTGDPFKLHCEDPAPKSNALIWLYHGILENGIGLQLIPLEMCLCFWIFYQTWIVGEGFNNLLLPFSLSNWIWERTAPN